MEIEDEILEINEENFKFDKLNIVLRGKLANDFMKFKKDFGYRKNTEIIDDFIFSHSVTKKFLRWFMQERSRQGNNLNQIAKNLNSGNPLDDAGLKKLEEIKIMEKELYDLVKIYANK